MNVKDHFHSGFSTTVKVSLTHPTPKFSITPFITRSWIESLKNEADKKKPLSLKGHSHKIVDDGIPDPFTLGGKLRLVGNKFKVHSHMSVSVNADIIPPAVKTTYTVFLPPAIPGIPSVTRRQRSLRTGKLK